LKTVSKIAPRNGAAPSSVRCRHSTPCAQSLFAEFQAHRAADDIQREQRIQYVADPRNQPDEAAKAIPKSAGKGESIIEPAGEGLHIGCAPVHDLRAQCFALEFLTGEGDYYLRQPPTYQEPGESLPSSLLRIYSGYIRARSKNSIGGRQSAVLAKSVRRHYPAIRGGATRRRNLWLFRRVGRRKYPTTAPAALGHGVLSRFRLAVRSSSSDASDRFLLNQSAAVSPR